MFHKYFEGKFYAYGPYVREMNLWISHVDRIMLLVPISNDTVPDPIDLPYLHPKIEVLEVPEFNVLGFKNLLDTLFKLPSLWSKTWSAMEKADHIHLRCPGNMGLLGAVVQIFFPKKKKSAKYAGNWDRKSSQPFTYRLQQHILSSTLLSKNIKVLVYGEWPGESTNIYSFFTASYSNKEITPLEEKYPTHNQEIRLIFAGGLNEGKQPMISAIVAKILISKGYKVRMDFFGEGPERKNLEDFIAQNELQEVIFLHGNVPSQQLKSAFQQAHFLIFISQSEGWPKVVAEAMFWGCIPITTSVSCVPQMLDFGERGSLVNADLGQIGETLEKYIKDSDLFVQTSRKAAEWSRKFTLEKFGEEIKFIINGRA